MKESQKKVKPALQPLLNDQQVITGKKLVERQKAVEDEARRQKAIMDEAIEFEGRNKRRNK
jgi:hypothetical protein